MRTSILLSRLFLLTGLFVFLTGFTWKKTNVSVALSKKVQSYTDTIPSPKQEAVFEKAEVEASVDATAWRYHLEKNLHRAIDKATKRGMPSGTYTIMIRFLVEKDGTISDIVALNDPGYGLAKSVADVVKRGPRWSPALMNGKPLRSYHTQPITFIIS